MASPPLPWRSEKSPSRIDDLLPLPDPGVIVPVVVGIDSGAGILPHDADVQLASIVGLAMKKRIPAFLFVNNRLEGHAPSTIEAVVDGMTI
jgi:hypothetical protein